MYVGICFGIIVFFVCFLLTCCFYNSSSFFLKRKKIAYFVELMRSKLFFTFSLNFNVFVKEKSRLFQSALSFLHTNLLIIPSNLSNSAIRNMTYLLPRFSIIHNKKSLSMPTGVLSYSIRHQ